MTGKKMSDWELEARKFGLGNWAWRINTEKTEDLRRLQSSGLPHYETIILPYSEFNEGNNKLMRFIDRGVSGGRGFVIRALPTIEGKKRGFSRRPKIGFMGYNNLKGFLDSVVGSSPAELWDVGLDEWEPSKYGGILTFSEQDRYLYGEIGYSLIGLETGSERPFASFSIDRQKLGAFLEDKTTWNIERDQNAKGWLLKALDYLVIGDDHFDPELRKGYFEFVIPKKREKVVFVDYKINKEYRK